MPRVNNIELIGGAFIFLVGLVFLFGAQDYRMGTAARMGPGFVPFYLGIVQSVLGLAIILGGLKSEVRFPHVQWREALAIIGGVGAFALVLPRFGLIPAIAATVAIAMLGNRDWRPMPIAILAVIMALFCWIIFVRILGLPMPAFRSPF